MLFSEPKIPQSGDAGRGAAMVENFSALQRAENSSMTVVVQQLRVRATFQCSSASRKFLNQREMPRCRDRPEISVLFSEPKIPQWLAR